MMRILFAIIILTSVSPLVAQRAFPIKVNQQWGLMNNNGNIIVEPAYQAIGEFKRFGYAIMQRTGGVGILNEDGMEVIAPLYEDIKVLDSMLFAVRHEAEWMVINLIGKVVLEKGYERVQIWEGGYLGYRKHQLWGVKKITGESVILPHHESIELLPEGYFQITAGKKIGLLSPEGQPILAPTCKEIKVYSDSLFFFRQERSWGAVNQVGRQVIEPAYERYSTISEAFLRLTSKNQHYLFSMDQGRVISREFYDDFYPFSRTKVLCKKDRMLGLLDHQGNEILPTTYNEIQPFQNNLFRIRRGGQWGIINTGLELMVPLEYDYISRPQNQFATVRKNGLFGAINLTGEIGIPVEYDRIEWMDGQARAFKGESLKLYDLTNEDSALNSSEFKKHFTITIGPSTQTRFTTSDFSNDNSNPLLEKFEWFYSSRDDKWGLRRVDNGEEQIAPSFHTIQIERNFGLTIVGIENFNYQDFERTSYRFDMVYGVVNNEVGLLVTEVNLWDIRLSDFSEGSRVARCVFANGRHGLMSRKPLGLFVKKDFAYIGSFKDGVARMSIKGKLSGKIKAKKRRLDPVQKYLDQLLVNNYMIDYTLYDQEFENNASLVCEDCLFGYVDTIGEIVVSPQFDYAETFVNQVGIVTKAGKSGLLNAAGKMLIPCKYDQVKFLENTNDKVLRIANNKRKYGLIDTLGRVVVDLQYDEIGHFRENRLAVERNGLWGFVDEQGREVIPCRFRKVQDFHDGLAAVLLGRKWGMVDPLGNVVVDFKYRAIGNFSEGLAWAATIKGTGFLDRQGELVIPAKFDKAADFEQNVARVLVDGEWGLINKAGKYFMKPKYSEIRPFSVHGTAVVRIGKANFRYTLINRTGNLISRRKYKKIAAFSEGFASVKWKDRYGFINAKGILVIDAKYSEVADFKNGRAMVKREGLCGYVDPTGYEVVSPAYSKCLDYTEGKAIIYKGYRQGGIIDTTGNFIIEPSVNRLLDFNDGNGLVRDHQYRFYYITEGAQRSESFYQQAGEFKNGVAVVQSNNKWGIINQRGIEIIPPKYDKIDDFNDGYAVVRINRFCGLSNLKGELIIPPEFEFIDYAGDGLFRVEQGDKVGYFDTVGKWIWDLRE